MLGASNIIFDMFLGLGKIFNQQENLSSGAVGESSSCLQEAVPANLEPLSIKVDQTEVTPEIAPEEAQYFQDRLRAWYDRTDEVGGAAGKRISIVSPPRSPFSPGRQRSFVDASTSFNHRVGASTSFGHRTQSLERKAVTGTSIDKAISTATSNPYMLSQLEQSSSQVSSAFTPEQVRQRLGTIGKAELTSLIIEYHRALADLGHLSEANLLLEAVTNPKPLVPIAYCNYLRKRLLGYVNNPICWFLKQE